MKTNIPWFNSVCSSTILLLFSKFRKSFLIQETGTMFSPWEWWFFSYFYDVIIFLIVLFSFHSDILLKIVNLFRFLTTFIFWQIHRSLPSNFISNSTLDNSWGIFPSLPLEFIYNKHWNFFRRSNFCSHWGYYILRRRKDLTIFFLWFIKFMLRACVLPWCILKAI